MEKLKTLNISETTHKALREEYAKSGVTIKVIVEKAVSEYLGKEEKKVI